MGEGLEMLEVNLNKGNSQMRQVCESNMVVNSYLFLLDTVSCISSQKKKD